MAPDNVKNYFLKVAPDPKKELVHDYLLYQQANIKQDRVYTCTAV
jgi:hypothetical protein